MLKVHKFMLKVWLIVAILCVLFSCYMLITRGWEGGKMTLFLPLIAGVWYGMRRVMVARLEKILAAEEKRNQEKSES